MPTGVYKRTVFTSTYKGGISKLPEYIRPSWTNEYSNLAIAHLSCNKIKHNKTEEEYRKEGL